MNEFDTCLLELDFWPNNQKKKTEKKTPHRLFHLQVCTCRLHAFIIHLESIYFFLIRMNEKCIICPCRWPRTRVDCADMQEKLGWVHWPLSKKQHIRGEVRILTRSSYGCHLQLCYIHLFISSILLSFPNFKLS